MLIAFIVGAMSTADGRQGRRRWRGARRRRHYTSAPARLAERCVAARRSPRLEDVLHVVLVSAIILLYAEYVGGDTPRLKPLFRLNAPKRAGPSVDGDGRGIRACCAFETHRIDAPAGAVLNLSCRSPSAHRVLACSAACTAVSHRIVRSGLAVKQWRGVRRLGEGLVFHVCSSLAKV